MQAPAVCVHTVKNYLCRARALVSDHNFFALSWAGLSPSSSASLPPSSASSPPAAAAAPPRPRPPPAPPAPHRGRSLPADCARCSLAHGRSGRVQNFKALGLRAVRLRLARFYGSGFKDEDFGFLVLEFCGLGFLLSRTFRFHAVWISGRACTSDP